MSQDKHDVSDPDVNPKVNPLFEPQTKDTRIEALTQVMDVLRRAKPVNLFSPIMIVSPKAAHNGWRYAVRRAGITRHVEYKTATEFLGLASTFEDQWVIIADDIYPEMRPIVRDACKKLNMDLGPRFFTVTPEYKVPVAEEDQMRILQIVPMEEVKNQGDEDPNG